MSESEAEVVQFRLVLEGEMARRFLTIKKHYGFENNTDTIRLLITQAYEEIVKGRE
jgi:hypothetical protein